MSNISQLIDSFDQCLSAKALNVLEFERLNLLFQELNSSFSSAQAEQLLLSYSNAKIINVNFVQQTLVPFCLKHQDKLGTKCQIKFSHFLAQHNIYNKKFCETLIKSFLSSASELDTESLVDIQWSLSNHKFYDENFFRKWQARIPEKLPEISNHDLSKSILAVAKNNYFSHELVRDYIQECNKRSFNRREAINIAYGLSILMVTKVDSDKNIHDTIFGLLESMIVSDLKNEIEIRQIISSYHSLDKIQQDSLIAIKSKLEPWENMLRNVSKFTISEPQTAITQYLKKYDPSAQEEAWFFPIATSVDIYLPSIRTFVQVDGKRHFYNNRPDLYLSTTQFNTEMIERYAKLLRLSNFHAKSYHRVIINELTDQFFVNQKASYVSYSQESAAAVDTSDISTAEIKNKKTKKKETKQNNATDNQVSKQKSKGTSKTSSRRVQEEENWEEILKEFSEPQQVGDLPLNVEIEQFKINHDIKKNPPLEKLLKLCIEHENFSLATRIFIENPKLVRPEVGLELFEHCIKHENFSLAIRIFIENPKLIRPEVGLELFEHCIKHENFDLANSIFIKIPNLIEPKKITDFIIRISSKPNLNLEPQYDQLIELVNTAIHFDKLDMKKIFSNPQISAVSQLLIDSNYDFNQTFLTPNFETGELHRLSIFSRLCIDGDENNVNKILRQGRVNCDSDKELFTPFILAALYTDHDSLVGLNKQYNTVKLLLEHNFSPNVYDPSDSTSPLLYCMQSVVRNMHVETESFSLGIAEHFSKLANLLISHDASVFITPDEHNASILMYASMSGHLDIVKTILEKGCPYDIDLTSKTSVLSSLCLAITHNNNQIATLLTDHGAKINQGYGSNSDMPPLFFAIQKRNLEAINMLLEKGAYLNYTTSSGISAIDILDEDYTIDYIPSNISAEVLSEIKLDQKKLHENDGDPSSSSYNFSFQPKFNDIPIINIVKVLFQNGFYNLESFAKYTNTKSMDMDYSEEIVDEIRKYQQNPIKYIVQNNDNYQSKLKALETLANAPSLGEMQSNQAKRVMHTLKELSRTDNISRAGSMSL